MFVPRASFLGRASYPVCSSSWLPPLPRHPGGCSRTCDCRGIEGARPRCRRQGTTWGRVFVGPHGPVQELSRAHLAFALDYHSDHQSLARGRRHQARAQVTVRLFFGSGLAPCRVVRETKGSSYPFPLYAPASPTLPTKSTSTRSR